MRLLIVGLGSMGKRRVRNLQHLRQDVVGFDPRADRRDEAAAKYGIPTVASAEDGFAASPDAVVISTPPDLHTVYARDAVRHGLGFFTEAGVLVEGLGDLEREAAAAGVVAAPSCTMRYFAGPRRIREVVSSGALGSPQTFVYHTGQWLPDWHPWENYRDFYVSRRLTGACREIVPFELTWLTQVFGDVVNVQGYQSKQSSLDADIDDVYQGLYRFSSGVAGMLQVDVLARSPVRSFRLLCSEGTIEWDAVSHELRVFQAASRAWTIESLASGRVEPDYASWSTEEPYVSEMRDFLAAVRGERRWGHPLDDDRRILDTLLAVETSHREGRLVTLRGVRAHA